MDYREPICPFDTSAYTGAPDSEPTGETIPVRGLIARLDALYNGGREAEAGAVSVRNREQGDQGSMPLDDFLKQIRMEAQA